MSHRALPLAVALAAAGCFVEPVDLGDRECPCAQGFVCNELGRCCAPTPFVSDFEMEWATATSIRWHWTPNPHPEAGFTGYEIAIACAKEQGLKLPMFRE